MKLTFRWYGADDAIPLQYIRQIPAMRGIVSAIYNVPVGDAWTLESILAQKQLILDAGLEWSVIESVPVHEDIKLGLPSRDQYIANYITTLKNLAKADIRTVCYNFMPVFDWTRSSLDHPLDDGSTALIYDDAQVERMNPAKGELRLPGWDTSYTDEQLAKLFAQYKEVDAERLWENLNYFIQAIVPVAVENNLLLTIHPDDPPWSIFGLPRIITNRAALDRFVSLHPSKNHGICLCTGSLGASPENNLPEMIRHFGKQGRIHFVHARNVKITGHRSFEEAAHLSEKGSVDMYEVVKALRDIDYTGPIRPDHGRMIWGETGKPGYGLYDRALGAVYLNGIWEAVTKAKK